MVAMTTQHHLQNMPNTTPSEQCKAAGLKSLAELAQISGVSVQTLINWHKDKPALFATVIAGAVVIEGG
jgi:hypothetical protein